MTRPPYLGDRSDNTAQAAARNGRQTQRSRAKQLHRQRDRHRLDAQLQHIGGAVRVDQIVDVSPQDRVHHCQEQRAETTLNALGNQSIEDVARLRRIQPAAEIGQSEGIGRINSSDCLFFLQMIDTPDERA